MEGKCRHFCFRVQKFKFVKLTWRLAHLVEVRVGLVSVPSCYVQHSILKAATSISSNASLSHPDITSQEARSSKIDRLACLQSNLSDFPHPSFSSFSVGCYETKMFRLQLPIIVIYKYYHNTMPRLKVITKIFSRASHF